MSEGWRERYQVTIEEPDDYDAWRMAIEDQAELWKLAKAEDYITSERQAMTNIDYLLGVMGVRCYVYDQSEVHHAGV